jgi:hypothetical protein
MDITVTDTAAAATSVSARPLVRVELTVNGVIHDALIPPARSLADTLLQPGPYRDQACLQRG